MELKRDEHGHVVVVDGNPVYRHSDGKEIPFDAAGTVATISRLNGEAKTHREAKEAAQAALKVFEGLDPEAARKALETVANLDTKKLVDAGEVQRVKDEVAKVYDEKLIAVRKEFEPVVTERDGLRGALHAEKIGNAFSRSKFIAEKLAIPADLVQAAFGTSFAYEDNSIIAKDKNGNKLLSRAKPGDIASFDEALEMLVESYPGKDAILKGSGAKGGGAGGGSNGGNGKTMTRAAFDNLDQSSRVEFFKGGGKLADAA